jgi:hypothetical protein
MSYLDIVHSRADFESAADRRSEEYQRGWWVGYAKGEENAKATVKDWHPKCATCRYYDESEVDCALHDFMLDERLVPDKTSLSHYCADHTALNPLTDPDHA